LGPKISMVVSYIHRTGISHEAKKYTLEGQKNENNPLSPKTEFEAQNQWPCDHRSEILHGVIKNVLHRVEKAKISQKRNLGPIISKINFPTKKIKTSRHFKKCMLKKFSRTQKKKTS
jgi:hypothetical protein